MLLFVMMLMSTGLMYYYFQRTRFLERQVMALQDGGTATVAQSAIPWDILGLGSKKESPARPTPVPPAAIADAKPEEVQEPVEQDLPPTGAASTPRPQNRAPVERASTAALNLQEDAAAVEQEQPQNEPVDPPEPVVEEPAEEEFQMEEPAANQPIDSLYDAQPPVRVRTPQR